jgi:ABC-type oligopeptide transport system ATPase subunit
LLGLVPITSDLISSTKVGKTLNRFVKEQVFKDQTHKNAEALVNRWKDIVNREKKEKRPEEKKLEEPKPEAKVALGKR